MAANRFPISSAHSFALHFRISAAPKRHVFPRGTGQAEYEQALPAQTDFIQQPPDIFEPALRTPASFEVVAVAFVTGNDAHQIGSSLERFEEMLRLELTRARHDDFMSTKRPIHRRQRRALPYSRCGRNARTPAVRADKKGYLCGRVFNRRTVCGGTP